MTPQRVWWAQVGFVLVVLAAQGGCGHVPPLSSSLPAVSASATGGAVSKAQQADVQIALGRMLEGEGQVGPAVRAYTLALQKDPGRADACARLAVLHDRQGKFEESARWYERALTLRPDDPDVLADRGYSRYLQQRWQEAEEDLRRALRLKPDHRRAHNNLGLVLARLGRSDEALASFRRAGCDEAEARANLAYALTLERHLDEAVEQYEVALGHDPSCAVAAKGLKTLKQVVAKLEPSPEERAVVRVSATKRMK
jgi:Tfp pilus assembly protein PilF